jgi:hypothetical protein
MEYTMNTERLRKQDSKLCDRLKDLGFAKSKRIRMYGEEFEMVSDPFPVAGGIAVEAASPKDRATRTVQLPRPILEVAAPKSGEQ